eukprot:g1930.t1
MEQKRSRKQDSSGWWPVDLDTESKNADVNGVILALLSLWAASHGARVWAVEAIPDLRELAQETVRDHGLEMVFKQKGLADFRFFGGSRMPGEPSVRVQNPALSTAMEALTNLLVPSALGVGVTAVEWMPWVDGSVEATCCLQPILGARHEEVLMEHLKCLTSEVGVHIDLTSRLDPAVSDELEATVSFFESVLPTSLFCWQLS